MHYDLSSTTLNRGPTPKKGGPTPLENHPPPITQASKQTRFIFGFKKKEKLKKQQKIPLKQTG